MTRITDSTNKTSPSTIKFIYSFGGMILPHQIDGKLRYVGGLTRILTADRSEKFLDLMFRIWDGCGFAGDLKCKLPSEDLDVLVTVTSDEDLASVVEEYDRFSSDAMIRAVVCSVNYSSKKTIGSNVVAVETPIEFSGAKPPAYPVVAAYKPYADTNPKFNLFAPGFFYS